MATESVTTASNDGHEKSRDIFQGVMDNETAATLFKAMAVLSFGIETTIDRSLDRVFLNWPQTAEAVWDMLDSIMVRAGVSDGADRPWISAHETTPLDTPQQTAPPAAGAQA